MEDKMIDRIESDPNICHGQPCIKGTRIMVYIILELLETGLTANDIIRDYYHTLAPEDIKACLHYATSLIREQEYVPFEESIH
jgi:uncharacterized protein (DUF433 family)